MGFISHVLLKKEATENLEVDWTNALSFRKRPITFLCREQREASQQHRIEPRGTALFD